ncbi:hypothetical protein [Streptomyces prunicolor]|uniref:Secreted protein n=1 Tax=Streptomyces prunicolor TaxID=67348 RepID=A0ABU4FQZ0_9ACTN|nr:hypothetical protein [Streptomyces prunicolor]MDV7223034.1 hypothetical protein [Streptomyces prunicolor]
MTDDHTVASGIGAAVIGGVVLALVGIGLGIAVFVVRRRAVPVAPWPVQQGWLEQRGRRTFRRAPLS